MDARRRASPCALPHVAKPGAVCNDPGMVKRGGQPKRVAKQKVGRPRAKDGTIAQAYNYVKHSREGAEQLPADVLPIGAESLETGEHMTPREMLREQLVRHAAPLCGKSTGADVDAAMAKLDEARDLKAAKRKQREWIEPVRDAMDQLELSRTENANSAIQVMNRYDKRDDERDDGSS